RGYHYPRLALRRIPARGDVGIRSGDDDECGRAVGDPAPVRVRPGEVHHDLVALPQHGQQAGVRGAVRPDGDELTDVDGADQLPDLVEVPRCELARNVHGGPQGLAARKM